MLCLCSHLHSGFVCTSDTGLHFVVATKLRQFSFTVVAVQRPTATISQRVADADNTDVVDRGSARADDWALEIPQWRSCIATRGLMERVPGQWGRADHRSWMKSGDSLELPNGHSNPQASRQFPGSSGSSSSTSATRTGTPWSTCRRYWRYWTAQVASNWTTKCAEQSGQLCETLRDGKAKHCVIMC